MGGLSKSYYEALEDCKAFHSQWDTSFSGHMIYAHLKSIRALIESTGSREVLDYGCGKGEQYRLPIPDTKVKIIDFWGVSRISLYDPAWPPVAHDPSPADCVICTHVIGSIPVADLKTIIDRIYSLANKAVYFGELVIPRLKKQIFRNPEVLPIGWSEYQWTKTLRRRDFKGEAVVGFLKGRSVKPVSLS